MIDAECIGGPLDGEICPLFDGPKLGDVYHLRGGDWPDTTKTGARSRLEYIYREPKRLFFKKYV